MSDTVKTNFGSIQGRRIMTFKVSHDGRVLAAKDRLAGRNTPEDLQILDDLGELITAHESFRRWKIGRKAWQTRKWRQQLKFSFVPQP